MRSEHLQAWLAETKREERPDTEKWDKVVDMIQYAFREGRIPVECKWQTLVLIPKGNDEFCGIRLMEVIWKAVLGVVNFWIGAAVDFHVTLHSFRAGRGTGTASLEVNIIQQLMAMREEVLYEVFLDLQKSYDALEQEYCMEILVG